MIKVYNLILFVFLFLALGCNFLDEKAVNSRKLASTNVQVCNKTQEVENLKTLFEVYEFYPPYIISLAVKSIVDCIGPATYYFALQEIKKTHVADFKKTRNRSIAQATSNEVQSYRNYRDAHSSVDLMGKGFDWAGDAAVGATVFASSLGAITGLISLPSAGVYVAGAMMVDSSLNESSAVFSKMSNAFQIRASQYYDQLITSYPNLDRSALLSAMSKGRSLEEKALFFSKEIQRQSLGGLMPDELTDVDKIMYMQTGLETALALYGESMIKIDSQSKTLEEIRNEMKTLDLAMTSHLNLMEEQSASLDAQTKIVSQGIDDLSLKMNFQMEVLFKNMSTREKIIAIENYGVGNFENDDERKKTLDFLNQLEKAEEIVGSVNKYTQAISNTVSIFNNLGFESKELSRILQVANYAQTLSVSYFRIMSSDVLGGIAGITSLFGKKKDANQEMLKHLMKIVQQMMAMLKTIVKLQYGTLHVLDMTSNQISSGLRRMERNFVLSMQLQQMNFISNYINKIGVIENCSDWILGLKVDLLSRTLPQEIAQSAGLWSNINSSGLNYETMTIAEKNRSYINEVALQSKTLPRSNLETLVSVLNNYESKEKIESCLDSLIVIRDHLVSFYKRRTQLSLEYTQLGREISSENGMYFKDFFDEEIVRSALFTSLISIMKENQKDTKNSLPAPILFSGTNPSYTLNGLIRKIDWIRKNSRQVGSKLEKLQNQRILNEDFNPYSIIDPKFFISFARSYIQIIPFVNIVNKDRSNTLIKDQIKDVLADHSSQQAQQDILFNLAMLTELVIFQQTLLNGDVMLEIYDKYFEPGYLAIDMDETSTLVDDVFNESQRDMKSFVNELILRSPVILQNLIRYRIAKAFRKNGTFDYVLKYKTLIEADYAELFQKELEPIGLEVFRDASDNNNWFLRFKSGPVRSDITRKEDLKTQSQEGSLMSSEDRQADQAVSAVMNNIAQRMENLEKAFQFRNKFEIPTPDEVNADLLINTPYLQDLAEIRDYFLFEKYNSDSAFQAKGAGNNLVFKRLMELGVQ